MNVVDSSGWLEYIANGPNSDFFAEPIEDTSNLLVPTISILEVFKWVLRERGEADALQSAALMQQGEVIPLDTALATRAATRGILHKLPLADSIMFATAEAFGATLWTQDADFAGLPGVKYTPKKQR
ncbi:MAG: type II toxin-antitoxin system VapC family toxin [Gemmatimonadetes bacterium]|nr:type II toxin-antitoxin system VapC family toxin [Gemmatimonadota bacterium]